MKTQDTLKTTIIILAIAFCPILKAQKTLEQTTVIDTASTYLIQLKDNTSLSGKILENKGGELVFKDITIGKVTIAWMQISKIARLSLSENQYCILTTNDGKKFLGLIQAQNDKEITLKTQSLGAVTISTNKIREITLIEKSQIIGGKYHFPNPHPTRYFFGPTAIPLEKGAGYFQNSWILSNSVQVGMTDNFSMGGGIVIPFLFFITPKWGYKVADKVHVGGGILFATSFSPDFLSLGIGIAYGSLTLGSKENNFTINAGWGTLKQEDYNYQTSNSSYSWKAAKKPMFSFSAMARLAPKVSFVTENWVFAYRDENYSYSNTGQTTTTYSYNYHSVISLGFRIMGEKNSFDFGAAFLSGLDDAGGIPYIAYAFKF